MSQRAISAALTGEPNAGTLTGADVGWAAQAESAAVAATTRRLGVNIFHAPVRIHGPADDRVVVKAVVRRVARLPLLARRLDIALFVGGAALQHRRLAGPLPGQAEAYQGFRTLFAGERRIGPCRAAIGGDLGAPDAPRAAPGDAGDLVEPGARQLHRR